MTKYLNPPMTENELLEMSNFWGENLGLDKSLVLWIGSSSSAQCRIKVSNLPKESNMHNKDCFTISIPNLEIIGNVNKEHITTKKLKSIFEFIKRNKGILLNLCEGVIDIVDFTKKITNDISLYKY